MEDNYVNDMDELMEALGCDEITIALDMTEKVIKLLLNGNLLVKEMAWRQDFIME